MKTGMKQKSILIKKYENRRLYDITNSLYVNLDEIAKMIQNGANLRVVDATTDEDITRLILTQIIVEDAKMSDSNFPLDVLRQMVIASGKVSQESALQYIKALLDISQNSYGATPPALNPFEFIPTKDSAAGVGPEPQPVPSGAKRGTHKARNSDAREVKELKRRLAELETLVSRISPKKAPSKKK